MCGFALLRHVSLMHLKRSVVTIILHQQLLFYRPQRLLRRMVRNAAALMSAQQTFSEGGVLLESCAVRPNHLNEFQFQCQRWQCGQ